MKESVNILQKINEIIGSLPSSEAKQIALKKLKIAECIISVANRTSAAFKNYPKHNRKIPFNKVDRIPIKRINKQKNKILANQIMGTVSLDLLFSSLQIYNIQTTPTPKYPKGS